jgi:virulence factor Mce-like protein
MAREEFKAGFFTLAALGVLSVFIIAISGWSPWKETVNYRTQFPTVVGMGPGTPVSLNGVNVGQVTQVVLLEDGARVEVVFGLDNGRRLHEGVKAQMATQGLIGDTFLLLTLTQKGGKELPPGSLIDSVTKLDMAQTMDAVGSLAASAQVWLEQLAIRVDTILSDVQLVVNEEKMQGLAGQVGNWQSNVTQILHEFAELSTEIRALVQEAHGVVEEANLVVDEVRYVVKDTDKVVEGADELLGTANRVIEGAGEFVGEAREALSEDQEYVRQILTELDARVKILAPRLERLVQVLEKAVHTSNQKLNLVLDEGEKVVQRTSLAAEITLEDVVTVSQNLAQASRNLISLTERLKDNPSLLIRGSGTGK